MNVVLVGFMGSGKTAVSRLLAKKLGWTSLDTDEEVEKKAGRKIADIFAASGEAAFRALEREAVRAAVREDRCVISTGGGVLVNPENADDLRRNGVLIWLKASPQTILTRIHDARSRPLIDPKDPEGSVARLLREREPVYRACHTAVVTDGLSADEVSDKIELIIRNEYLTR